MENTPKVSVCIPAYNEEKSIARTLESVFSQDYSGEIEVIVCDNASTDRTVEIISKFNARVVKESQKGSRFAYNSAMRAATSELILVTNADTKVPPNWVSRIVEEYKDPEVVGVGTKVLFENAPGYANFMLNLSQLFDLIRGMWGPSLSARKEAFEKVGGIDHGSNTNEDGIFTLLLRKEGKVKFIDDVVVRMDGRRYKRNFFSTLKEWFSTIGINSIYVQIAFLLTGEVHSLVRNFSDFREEDN